MASAAASQQPQQYNRGILPSETLNALDYLVDRINSSSGHLNLNSDSTDTSNISFSSQPLRALLVGTNEGVGLSRSLGTRHSSQLSSPEFSFSGDMSEEVLSSIETVWATLVSAASPHVMATAASGAGDSNGGYNQPPHPLLAPLHMGNTVKTVTACYDNYTLIHIHLPPLVVTLIASPEINLGVVKQMAIPKLKVLFEPVRRALVRSRGGGERRQTAQQQQALMMQQQQSYGQNQVRG
eukprot:scaffold81049_cov52-Cyclotella_meneghiniana.AAC.2